MRLTSSQLYSLSLQLHRVDDVVEIAYDWLRYFVFERPRRFGHPKRVEVVCRLPSLPQKLSPQQARVPGADSYSY